MFLICFVLWIILCAKFSVEVLLIGVAIAGFINFFCYRYLDYSFKKDIRAIRKIGSFLKYIVILVWETIIANLEVSKIVYSKKVEVSPCIIFFKTDIKSKAAQVLLANSITLTPGTITLMLTDDILCVHCLDKQMMSGIEESSFVKQLRKIEEL